MVWVSPKKDTFLVLGFMNFLGLIVFFTKVPKSLNSALFFNAIDEANTPHNCPKQSEVKDGLRFNDLDIFSERSDLLNVLLVTYFERYSFSFCINTKYDTGKLIPFIIIL